MAEGPVVSPRSAAAPRPRTRKAAAPPPEANAEGLDPRELLDALVAFKSGDFSIRLPRHLGGVDGKIADAFNDAIDMSSRLCGELQRLARVVGEDGKISNRASLGPVGGGWAACVTATNELISDLAHPIHETARVIGAVARGDLSQQMALESEERPLRGEFLRTARTVNTMVGQLGSFASEVTRVAREVGTEGKLGGQADVKGVAGVWKDLTDNVNSMASNLTDQVRGIAKVVTAVATGDLSRKITVDVKGEILELKDTINTMVDQLNSFAAEVTRVAREVGTEGKLGGQAEVRGAAGVWKDLTDNVNSMASNITDQVRGIVKVVTAVATGDLKRQLTVEAKGEIAALADTINGMIETLATFADQVTTVAREVGVEGQLGGQASVPGAAGTWRDLTDNVNQLAANLTTQMRAIAEVATAVTTGDLTRSIAVEARGEVAALKDNINEMIRHLRDTTQKNSEQDWLKTNLAKFSRMLQGQKDRLTVGRLILSELAPVVSAQHGAFYILDASDGEPVLRLLASYARRERQGHGNEFALGQGLVGQCALEKHKILLTSVPPEYLQISSGLGEASPLNLIVLPVVFEGRVKAVVELASFDRFNTTHQAFLDQLTETIGIVMNTIEANTRTEDLLTQSQSLATELQNQQEELRQTNQQLEEKAGLLAQQNAEVERKNQEIEQARQALEEKAKQLALTSKYKSEFLANMSHELRTPLNSLLILSDQLSRNADGNLTQRQTEFAKTIHASGTDLLMLINDILDLSKIESGTVAVDAGELRFADLRTFVRRTFQHVADAKGLAFELDFALDLPQSMVTDVKRLQQIVKNLLSNAFKFTERGRVALAVSVARGGWSPEQEALQRADAVIAFSVSDTGIGIAPAKQQIIFEAFQQADGSTSRRYGGTGLGLAISREIAGLLGGDIRVASAVDQGSTFTLFLPRTFTVPPRAVRKAQSAIQEAPPAVVVERDADGDAEAPAAPAWDDRDAIVPGDRVVLIVENDASFAELALETAREQGWRALVAGSGAAAVALASEFKPDGITLDLRLPDIDGLRVLQRLKADPETRHLRVQVISTDDGAQRALALGAAGVLAKPLAGRDLLESALRRLWQHAESPPREILLPGELADELGELLGGSGAQLRPLEAGSPADAAAPEVAGAVLDARRGSVLDLARELREARPDLPVVLYTAPELATSRNDRELFRRGFVCAARQEDLLEQVIGLLHQPLDALPPDVRKVLEQRYAASDALSGRRALVVDDDVRNIFALTSVLEDHEMVVIAAESGTAAIDLLARPSLVDIVLMDLMMPGVDGFETIRTIRRMQGLRALPIVAVTAKAMKGDRERTIEAGAWDYLSKPVEPERILRVLRAWLQR